jgi:hypothetical protein
MDASPNSLISKSTLVPLNSWGLDRESGRVAYPLRRAKGRAFLLSINVLD